MWEITYTIKKYKVFTTDIATALCLYWYDKVFDFFDEEQVDAVNFIVNNCDIIFTIKTVGLEADCLSDALVYATYEIDEMKKLVFGTDEIDITYEVEEY